MILADLVLDLKFNNHFDRIKSHDRTFRYHSDNISFKRNEIRDYYQDKFEQVFTVEFLLDNKKYILGFDKELFYFYLFNCNIPQRLICSSQKMIYRILLLLVYSIQYFVKKSQYDIIRGS